MAQEETPSAFPIDVPKALNLLLSGHNLAEVAGFSEEQIDALYSIAVQLYEADNYEDAANIFKMLCLYQSQDPKHFIGLGSCYKEMGEYAKAVDVFSAADIISGLVDPKPHYYCGVCLLKLGKIPEAKTMFETLNIMDRKDHPEDKEFLDKGQKLLAMIDSVKP